MSKSNAMFISRLSFYTLGSFAFIINIVGGMTSC